MTPPRYPRWSPGLLTAAACVLLFASGCAAMWGVNRRTQHASSVVAYLYPGEDNPLPPQGIPVLRLPLKVGVAFVPAGDGRSPIARVDGLSEVQKTALMQRVANEFKGRDYIQSIELIPSSYLRPGGGFANLGQVRNLLGVDVVALIAYDQMQFTNENILSLSYWTIVGAYLFKGNKNDTQTLMEAAVYDIPSQHLLFRAPGTSQVQAGVAAVYVEQNLRADSAKSFDLATTDLIANLKVQLDGFRERVKNSTAGVQVVRSPGYTGGGSFEGWFVGGLLSLGVGRWLVRRR
jgi:rhombotail lipoprotein